MRILIIALVLAIALVGCCGLGGGVNAPRPTGGEGTGDNTSSEGTAGTDTGDDDAVEDTSGAEDTNVDETVEDDGTDTPDETPEPQEEFVAEQEECATMAPDCESCIAKDGCGWCKTRNGCFAGTSSGPADVDCAEGDWAKTENQCAAPAGGSTCGQQTNCAACTTGSACKWCRQGSICVEADNAATCLGGWLTEAYQCAQTSAG